MKLFQGAFGLNFTALMWCWGFLLLSLSATYMVSADSDLVLHIMYGKAILEQGFPTTDPLLIGATAPPVLQEWLFEVLVAWLDNLSGLVGPLLVFSILAGCLMAGVFQHMRNQGVCLWMAILYAVFILFALRTHLVIRPHLISWFAAPLLYVVLEDWWTGRRGFSQSVVVGGILMLVWVNMHGGFLIGLALTMVYVLESSYLAFSRRDTERFLQVVALFILFAGISFINPWGWNLHAHLVSFLSNDFLMSSTTDFLPPRFSNGTLPVLLITLAVIVLPMLLRRKNVALRHWLLLLGLSYAAATSLRNIPFLGLLMLPVAAVYLQGWLLESEKKFGRLMLESSSRFEEDEGQNTGFGWILLVVIGVSLLLVNGTIRVGLYSINVPVAALEWAEQQPELVELPVFADYMFAGYLLYGTPVERVYLHALNANYPAVRLQNYFSVDDGDAEWETVVENINWAFVRADGGHASTFAQAPCWQETYSDEQAIIFRRVCDDS